MYKTVPSACATASSIEVETLPTFKDPSVSESFDNTSMRVPAPATTIAASSTATGAVFTRLIATVTVASADAPSASVTE